MIGRQTKGNRGGVWISHCPCLSTPQGRNTPHIQGGKQKEMEVACWFHAALFVDAAGKRYPPVIGGVSETNSSGMLVSHHPQPHSKRKEKGAA